MPRAIRFLAVVIAAAGLNSLGATGSLAQDFDCNGARNTAEHVICNSTDLKQLDERMARAYGRLWARYSNAPYTSQDLASLRSTQREFLGSRDSCGANVRCIRGAYLDQIAFLTNRGRTAGRY